MQLGKPAGRTAKWVILLVMLFLALLFIIFFWNEPVQFILLDVGIISFFLVFALWVVLISFQALLPVSDLLRHPWQCISEVYHTCWHLLLYMFHAHGPAIFVKDGKANETTEDLQRENWPGVVVVDFNSAVVLEERNGPPGMSGALLGILMFILENLFLIDRKTSLSEHAAYTGRQETGLRVRGPGIVFTRPRERIRGTVDLRKQFRAQDNVKCYTRDGIELSARVNAAFTIGQDADVLQVTYAGAGDIHKENLSVVTLEAINNQVRISKFNDDPNELDPADRKEIYDYALKVSFPSRFHSLQPYTPLPTPPEQVQYNPSRVLNAVFAQARNGKQETISWTDLPTQVAAGIYREVLSQVNYDDLYDVKGSGNLPLDDFRAKVRFAVRNNGILSFRLVLARNGRPLVKGRLYRPNELLVSPIIPLANSKVLRNRGIKVLGSGFGNPTPINDAIYKQRLDNWRAEWQRDLDISSAARELEAMRVRARAHTEAQQEMWYSLSQLLESPQFNDEALTIRVLEAIEAAAVDPKTRALLPDETLSLLLHIERMLLPSASLRPLGPTGIANTNNSGGD